MLFSKKILVLINLTIALVTVAIFIFSVELLTTFYSNLNPMTSIHPGHFNL